MRQLHFAAAFSFQFPGFPAPSFTSSVRNFTLLSLLTCLGASFGVEEGGRRDGGTHVVTPSTRPLQQTGAQLCLRECRAAVCWELRQYQLSTPPQWGEV